MKRSSDGKPHHRLGDTEGDDLGVGHSATGVRLASRQEIVGTQ
jgi:hypothetical protein